MVRQAGADGRLVRALIDCGPDAGYAMLALRLGWREVHVTGEPSAVAGIEDMTLASGGVFHRELPGDRTGNGPARRTACGSGIRIAPSARQARLIPVRDRSIEYPAQQVGGVEP